MNFNDCLEKQLIKQYKDSKYWVAKEIANAEKFLEQANKIHNADTLEICEIAAYNSIFHSTRSLLYLKGYKERSHYCLFLAVYSLYSSDSDLLELLSTADTYRENREAIAYDGLVPTEKEVQNAIELAANILKKAKKIIDEKK